MKTKLKSAIARPLNRQVGALPRCNLLRFSTFLTLLTLTTLHASRSTLYAQGTAFTYNGRLTDGGAPANGNYDLTFTLFSAGSGPGQVGGTLTNAATAVSSGLFTVTLDFGANFPGADRWLEIGARTNGGGGFTTLSPRQKLTAVPYAITASNLTGTVSASQLTGTLPSAELAGTYSGAVALNNAANSFAGSGAGLSSLDAGNISSGTLNDLRLSANIPRLNANQSFTGANTFNNPANSFTGSFTGNGAGVTNVNLLTSVPAWAVTLTTNAGSFGFVSASGPLVGNGPRALVAADVNGDGKLDLISANERNNTLTVLTNNGSGGFGPASSPAVGVEPVAVTAADVNGDGKVDLISANENSSGTLTVLTNNGSGGFVLASSPTVGSFPISVVAADVNGDGKVDLICANETSSGTLTVLTNNGSGGFVLASSPTVGSVPISVVAADVNGDTAVDLICANNTSPGTLSVLLGNGSGGFVLASSPAVGSFPRSVVAADVDGDGKVDLISANEGNNTLTVLTNNGFGSFGSNATLTVGSAPYGVTAADVNGDGKVDLISANEGNNTLTVLTNDGSGGFVLAVTLTVGNQPYSVAAADVNGDGAVDLISANYNIGNAGTLSVLFNTLSLTTTTATFHSLNFTGATLNVSGTLAAGNFTGNGAGVTNLNGANLASGTVGLSQLAANSVDSSKIVDGAIVDADISSSAAIADTKLATIAAAGKVADTALSGNVALLNRSSQTFTGTNLFSDRIGIGTTTPSAKLDVQGGAKVRGFFTLPNTVLTPTSGGTLSPANTYVQLTPASALTLSATTAIASGTTSGDMLILENAASSTANTVTIPNGANTRLAGAASRVLGQYDTLILIWDGLQWVELSFANN